MRALLAPALLLLLAGCAAANENEPAQEKDGEKERNTTNANTQRDAVDAVDAVDAGLKCSNNFVTCVNSTGALLHTDSYFCKECTDIAETVAGEASPAIVVDLALRIQRMGAREINAYSHVKTALKVTIAAILNTHLHVLQIAAAAVLPDVKAATTQPNQSVAEMSPDFARLHNVRACSGGAAALQDCPLTPDMSAPDPFPASVKKGDSLECTVHFQYLAPDRAHAEQAVMRIAASARNAGSGDKSAFNMALWTLLALEDMVVSNIGRTALKPGISLPSDLAALTNSSVARQKFCPHDCRACWGPDPSSAPTTAGTSSSPPPPSSWSCQNSNDRFASTATNAANCLQNEGALWCGMLNEKEYCGVGTGAASSNTTKKGSGDSPCSDCLAGLYQTEYAASTSVECVHCPKHTEWVATGSYCAICASGQFQERNDERGASCARCPTGESLGSPANGAPSTSDLVSYANDWEDLKCEACQPGYTFTTKGTVDSPVTKCFRCGQGKFWQTKNIVTEKVSSTVMMCVACPAGYWNEDMGSTECTACKAGFYGQTVGGTVGYETESAACRPCLKWEYSREPGSTKCYLCRSCAEHPNVKHLSPENMVSHDLTFTDHRGENVPFHCDFQGEMSSCPDCMYGKYARGKIDAGANSINSIIVPPDWDDYTKDCIECPAGFSYSFRNPMSCDVCPAGFYAAGGSTECSACPTGRYGETESLKSAGACKACFSGQYNPNKASTSPNDCVFCPLGKYRKDTGGSSEAECDMCAPGRYGTAIPSPTEDQCDFCPKGRFSEGSASDNINNCEKCPTGYFSHMEGSFFCQRCLSGTYSDIEGLDRCPQCGFGRFMNEIGSSANACKQCPQGWKQNLRGQAVCQECASGKYTEYEGDTYCDDCPAGWYSPGPGSANCSECPQGRSALTPGLMVCSSCENGKRAADEETNAYECNHCPSGFFRGGDSVSSIVECDACPVGWVQPNKGESACIACPQGYRFVKQSQGSSASSTCSQCSGGLYQDETSQSSCKMCPVDTYREQPRGTNLDACKACALKRTTAGLIGVKDPSDCICTSGRYADDTVAEKTVCKECPSPQSICQVQGVTVATLVTAPGYWRSDADTTVFYKCQFEAACKGNADVLRSVNLTATVGEENKVAVSLAWNSMNDSRRVVSRNNVNDGNYTALAQCAIGHEGPLCATCSENFRMQSHVCISCTSSDAQDQTLGLLLVVGAVVVVFVLIWACRRQLEEYKEAWKEVKRIVSIEVALAQVATSMPSMLSGSIEMPANLVAILEAFSIVNIDLLSIIGAECMSVRGYQGRLGFQIGILSLTLFGAVCLYVVQGKRDQRRIAALDEQGHRAEQRKTLSELFHIVDQDSSGFVDRKELLMMLHSCGFKQINPEEIDAALLRDGPVEAPLSAATPELQLSLDAFLMGMLGTNDDASSTINRGRILSAAGAGPTLQTVVEWAAVRKRRSRILTKVSTVAILIHAPFSSIVLKFFSTVAIADKNYLLIDMELSRESAAWLSFLPVVLICLFGFTLLLPACILVRLWQLRDKLYTPHVQQELGFLYAPFRKGREWWQVFEIMRKLVLTGGLIFFPVQERAVYGALISALALANLNFWRPHKSALVFWVSNGAYAVALLLYLAAILMQTAAESSDDMGSVMIVIMGLALCAGGMSTLGSVYALRKKIVAIRQENLQKKEQEEGNTAGQKKEKEKEKEKKKEGAAGATTKVVPAEVKAEGEQKGSDFKAWE